MFSLLKYIIFSDYLNQSEFGFLLFLDYRI